MVPNFVSQMSIVRTVGAADALRPVPEPRALQHPLRNAIHRAVTQSPGLLAQEVADAVGSSRSTVRYHISRLQAAGLLRVVSYRQRVFLFARGQNATQQDALAVLRRGRTWELARCVAAHPGARQNELTTDLKMSRKVLRKHMDCMVDVGLVEEVAESPFQTYFPTPQLHKLIHLWPAPATPYLAPTTIELAPLQS